MILIVFRNNIKCIYTYNINRLKGPAAIFSNNTQYYYINGSNYTKDVYYEKLKELNININIK